MEFRTARADLLHASLVRHNDQKNEIWMHRVPRQVVRANLTGSSQLSAFSSAIRLVQAAWPVVPFHQRHTTARASACEKLLPHVLSLRDLYEKELKIKEPETEFELACLLQEAAWFVPQPLEV
jgi:hypothetical protein